jgi:hypothetical protein
MNDALNELQRQLEQATARDGAQQAPSDPETAALREAWTALGRLLAAAQPAEQTLLDRWKRPPSRPPRRWFRSPAVGLAVSLAVCAVAAWAWWGCGVPRPAKTPAQHAARSASPPLASPKVVAQRPAQSSINEPQWDDTLDEQFARLGQRVIRVEQDWTSQAVAHAVKQYEREQVRQDVSGDRL